jgi:hypothetical protein
MSTNRRLERLEREAQERAPEPSGRSEARERMREHLDRLVALRRGELSEEEGAEVRAANAAIRRRMAELRGEGAS